LSLLHLVSVVLLMHHVVSAAAAAAAAELVRRHHVRLLLRLELLLHVVLNLLLVPSANHQLILLRLGHSVQNDSVSIVLLVVQEIWRRVLSAFWPRSWRHRGHGATLRLLLEHVGRRR